ncbi:MAG: hypothetical protein HFH24_11675 [Ruminococcus sp.]|nr:hypothetical protein [Ruminococcus sp.]
MRKRVISMLCSLLVMFSMVFVTAIDVQAKEGEQKIVDGSYLTHEEKSTGSTASNQLLRGKYLMDGDSIISKAGSGRIYVYAETSADFTVDFLSVLVYVDRYNETTDKWDQVDAWVKEATNTYYVTSAKTLRVEGGYYYRVRSEHFAGNEDDRPYDSALSLTDGIWID